MGALGLLAAVAGGRPAMAADLENGESVFGANCASCHAGGNNSIVPEKKIKKEAIEKYLTGGYMWRPSSIRSPMARTPCRPSASVWALMTSRMSPTTCTTRRTSGEQPAIVSLQQRCCCERGQVVPLWGRLAVFFPEPNIPCA